VVRAHPAVPSNALITAKNCRAISLDESERSRSPGDDGIPLLNGDGGEFSALLIGDAAPFLADTCNRVVGACPAVDPDAADTAPVRLNLALSSVARSCPVGRRRPGDGRSWFGTLDVRSSNRLRDMQDRADGQER
jgi:hypothetical protein